jgi:hypothetical protein
MTSYKGIRLSPTSWGLSGRQRPGRPVHGLLDGTVLLAVWVALWTVFVLGVVEPAARFRGAAAGARAQVQENRT